MSEYCETVRKALALHQRCEYEKAKLLYVDALEENPYDPQALQLLGAILLIEKEYESAIHLIKNSIAIDPTIFESHNNLGHIYQMLNDYESAFEYYEKALELNAESALVHNNIATVYKQKGEFSLALKHYQSAIKYEPYYMDAYINLANLYYINNKFKETETISKKAISLKVYPADVNITLAMALQILDKTDESLVYLKQYLKHDMERFEVQVTLAIYSWIRGDIMVCKSYLETITQAEFDDKNLLDRFVVAYKTYLEQLIRFREINVYMYSEDKGLPVLYVIGDSHSLSYSNLKVTYRNKTYRIESKIIMGCKAWHLSTLENNKYKEQFKNILLNLEESSKVLVLFGEIDCRLDDGIMKHYGKSTLNKSISIQNLVKGYVEYVNNQCYKKKIETVFGLVPAPVFDNTVLTAQKEQLKSIIKYFNSTLQDVVPNNRVYDTYYATSDDNGESNQHYHIDRWHLSPKAIALL